MIFPFWWCCVGAHPGPKVVLKTAVPYRSDRSWVELSSGPKTGACFTHSFHCLGECLAWFNTLRPRQNGRHFADDIFKCIFLNENAGSLLKISLKFIPKVLINNIPALVQIMAWRRPGDKPLSEPMMVSLLTHICVTGPQWVNFTEYRASIH